MRKRKTISPKIRLEVLKRDNYTCRICGKSPAKYPELDLDVVELEVDHITPFSKGGEDSLNNFQTLCRRCNRGKGNDEKFNISIETKILNQLNEINQDIVKELNANKNVRIVANENDFNELLRLCDLSDKYLVKIIPNTIMGYHAGYNMGIYTVNDNGGSKINFIFGYQQDN
jgi:CRISPR/Cas system Type II protein with McrA/HNH and RuvC-like nuclease domain